MASSDLWKQWERDLTQARLMASEGNPKAALTRAQLVDQGVRKHLQEGFDTRADTQRSLTLLLARTEGDIARYEAQTAAWREQIAERQAQFAVRFSEEMRKPMG